MSATDAAPPPDINRGPEILAITGTLVGLALAVVCLRVYVRVFMVKHMGADDWTMVAAMVRFLRHRRLFQSEYTY